MAEDQRDPQGRLMLPLSESLDLYALRRAGELLEHQLGATAKDRFQAHELKFWDYVVRGIPVSLYWQRDVGLSLLAGDTAVSTETQLRELAAVVRTKLAESGLGT